MSGERHIELVWRCSSCGHQNLGRYMQCQGCGDPKDASEEYEMPADPSAAPSVTDPELLRMAEAGANWRCKYCGSDQRDLRGDCARCGGERARAAAAAAAMPGRAPKRLRDWGFVSFVIAALVVIAPLAACGVLVARCRSPAPPVATYAPPDPAPPPRTEFSAVVSGVSWKRTIVIERRQLVAHEGFASEVPEGAVSVKANGQRVHHHEDVYDHDETERYEVEVPDGFTAESYTERVRCGEDCKTTPRTCKRVCTRSSRSCRQVCTNKNNGFASCRDVCTGGDESCHDDCTGGDRSCTTKYCDERRTKQIPRTRKETRTRLVKKYRSEPRYAPWVSYQLWEWVPARNAELAGTDLEPRWPDAGGPLPDKERAVPSETLSVSFALDDGSSRSYVPSSIEELARFAPGSTHRVRIAGSSITVLE